LCRFAAIKDFRVDAVSCEGCGFCSHVCPAGAVVMKENMAGQWFISDSRYGPLVHARLGIAQENSGKLVAMVRQQARDMAKKMGLHCIISDGPPGIGCPVISSLSGASLALLVTEPTLSGIHDLERVLGVCHHFGIRPLVCINKHDINANNSYKIESYCFSREVTVAARIPFDNTVTEAMIRGVPVVEYCRDGVSRQIKTLWDKVSRQLVDKEE